MPAVTKSDQVWIGTAELMLAPTNAKRSEGFVGGYAAFACRADSFLQAAKALEREFFEAGYLLVGVQSMVSRDSLDRALTEHESSMVELTAKHAVQFRNVHLHKGNA